MLNISDFNRTGEPIPEDVADKIVEHHLLPLLRLQQVVDFTIKVSMKSGYRPLWYELEKGRDGTSQHTFDDLGAADLTCDNWRKNKKAFLMALRLHTEYTRIADYGSFFHCDHKPDPRGRVLFDKAWKPIKILIE